MNRRRRWIALGAASVVISLATACSLFVSLDGLQSSLASDAQIGNETGPDGSNGCDSGFASCGSVCGTNVASDPQNCGACGHVCGSENTTAAPTCVAGKCTFACAKYFDNCDGDGAHGCETALSAGNARACGSCTRDCLEGQCENYECTRITVVTDPNTVNDLAAADSRLYWTASHDDPGVGDGGCTLPPTAVYYAHQDGGSAAMLVAARQPAQLALDDGGIYFMSNACGIADSTLFRIGKDGTCSPSSPCPTPLAASLSYYTSALAIDEFHAYWFDVSLNRLHAVPLTGSVGEENIAGNFKATYDSTLTVDPGGPVWATPSYTGGGADGGAFILSIPPGGGGSSGGTVPLEATGQPGGITTDGKSIYWSTADGFIFSAARTGGPQTTVASAQQNPKDVLVDATTIYWINSGDGSIMRIGKDGKCRASASACPEILATSGTPRALALDDLAIYWADHNIIYKVAK